MLMRSISELKKKLALATAQGKDHRRSAMIRAMKIRLREQVIQFREKFHRFRHEAYDAIGCAAVCWRHRMRFGSSKRFRNDVLDMYASSNNHTKHYPRTADRQ